tara:strand:- start:511 stop:840 length:330 start_codon:yes stop_codon:yes gene_type:complete
VDDTNHVFILNRIDNAFGINRNKNSQKKILLNPLSDISLKSIPIFFAQYNARIASEIENNGAMDTCRIIHQPFKVVLPRIRGKNPVIAIPKKLMNHKVLITFRLALTMN